MRYSAKQYATALYDVLGKAGEGKEFSSRVRSFLGMLKKHGALKFLPSILKIVERLFRAKEAEIASPQSLSRESLAALQELLGPSYSIKEKTAPELIGGMVLTWDDWRVDASVRGQLKNLRSGIGK